MTTATLPAAISLVLIEPVTVLGVLDQEHHEKGNNRSAGIDDELPGVGKTEDRAADRPQYNDRATDDEGGRLSRELSNRIGRFREGVLRINLLTCRVRWECAATVLAPLVEC